MVKDLKEIGLWNNITLSYIQNNNGSLKDIDKFVSDNMDEVKDFRIANIPRLQRIQQKYKTMWEIPQKLFVDMAADRALYICQSQSLNIYLPDPTIDQLCKLHIYTAALGLKTGMYYLRANPVTNATKFGINETVKKFNKKKNIVCTETECTMCQ